MSKNNYHQCIKAAKWLVVIFAITYLFSTDRLTFQHVNIEILQWGPFFCAFVGLSVVILLGMVRLWVLLRIFTLGISVWKVFRIGFIGLFFNGVLLGAFGGDVVKLFYLSQWLNSKSSALILIMMDRVIGYIGLFFLAGVVVAIHWRSFQSESSLLWLGSSLVIIGSGL